MSELPFPADFFFPTLAQALILSKLISLYKFRKENEDEITMSEYMEMGEKIKDLKIFAREACIPEIILLFFTVRVFDS